jgi:hypothetical protein
MAEKKVVANFQIEAQSAKQELASLRAADEAFLKSGHALATDITQGFGEIETAVGKAFDKINSNGKISQGQFDAIVTKLATMKDAIENAGVPLDQLPEQFTKALSTGEKQVAALSGAMEAARLRTESLKEEFAKAGTEAAELAQKTATAGERIEDSAKRADAAFAKFTTTLQDNPKEALEQLPRVAGAVIQLRQEIERTQAAGGIVEADDIARLQQFESRLVETRESAKRLAVEIHAATGGIGGRIDGITDAVQGMAGAFGPAGQAIGGVAGQIGSLALGAEQAKNVFGGLNLNTLSLGASSTTLAVQMGAAAAAIVAAVAAGSKLAATNVENQQTTDDLKDSLGAILPSIDELKTGLDGVQMAAQNALASLMSGEMGDARRDVEAMAVAWKNGRDAGKLYYDLVNQGVGELAASEIASSNNRKAVDLYAQAMAQGGKSIEVWNETVRASNGDAEAFRAKLDELKIALDHEKTALGENTAEQLKNKLAMQEAAGAAAALAEQKRAATAETQRNVEQLITENEVVNGSTEAIRKKIAAIQAHIGESDLWSVSLGRTAAELQNVLNTTDGLTKVERARIQALIDLAKNANDLTEAEQKRAVALAEGIIAGTAATVALKDQALATKDLATATAEVATATAEAATANDLYRSSIEQELALVQAELEARGVRRDLTQQQTQINMDAGVSTDYLLQRERALAEQVAGPSLSSWSAAAKQKTEQKTATAELSALIEKEKAATAELDTETKKLTTSMEGGKVAITNTAGEVNKLVGEIKTWAGTYSNVSKEAEAAAKKGIEVSASAGEIKKAAPEAAAVMLGFADALARAREEAAGLDALLDGVNQKMRDMKKAAAEAAGAAEGAAPEAKS